LLLFYLSLYVIFCCGYSGASESPVACCLQGLAPSLATPIQLDASCLSVLLLPLSNADAGDATATIVANVPPITTATAAC